MKDTIKITDKGTTKMIAHRGASGLERENTLPAFIAAGNRSYFGAECDIHVTKDGKYVVYHDDETGRLCDKNVVIEETEFSTLRALKLKEPDSETFSETLKIPTPEEYLSVLSRYGKVAVIELKNAMKPANICEIIEICKQCYSLDRIVFISFCFENLVEVRKILPKQPVQFLCGDWSDELEEKLSSHRFDLDIGWWSLNEERIRSLHDKGIKINCWTCDDAEKAEQLALWGVDFITTNILE